jgi:mRNA interferase MazF
VVSTVICAPVYSAHHGLASQVAVGVDEGLKHESALHCDELVTLPKSRLTAYVGRLSDRKLQALDRALVAALEINLRSVTA